MKRIQMIFLGAILLGIVATVSQAAPIPSEPIYTSKPRFRIPFRFDSSELQRIGAREIRLFGTADQGATWHHIQSVAPETNRFDFQAQQDGEYWFAVRTVDSTGNVFPPETSLTPGLKVIVDSTEPALEVSVRQTAPGKVLLSWNADDGHLDLQTLSLEYIQSGDNDWQKVSVVPQSAGETAWSVPNGGVVAVRGSIQDSAGNIARTQSQAEIAPSSQAVPRPELPAIREPVANNFSNQPPFAPFPTTSNDNTSRQQMASTPDPFSAATTGQQDNFQPFPTSVGSGSPVIAPSSSTQFQSVPSTFPGMRQEGQQQAEQFTALQPTNISGGNRPSGRYRVVRSNRFQIDYKVEDVGPSGVAKVELFITQNNGEKWWKYGEDDDRQSPFHVEVPSDGTYGFALRVQSGVGLSDEPPQHGNEPTIVVVVDRAGPQAELFPLEQGRGLSLNKIRIRWQISDDNPASHPVALSYSSSPQGPWEPITGWLPDSGSHIWTVGPGVPTRFYVRLTARDAAGNVNRVQTNQPVLVDLSRPSARIVDVESISTDQQ